MLDNFWACFLPQNGRSHQFELQFNPAGARRVNSMFLQEMCFGCHLPINSQGEESFNLYFSEQGPNQLP